MGWDLKYVRIFIINNVWAQHNTRAENLSMLQCKMANVNDLSLQTFDSDIIVWQFSGHSK